MREKPKTLVMWENESQTEFDLQGSLQIVSEK